MIAILSLKKKQKKLYLELYYLYPWTSLSIFAGFKPHSELEKIVKGRLLLTDVKKLSPTHQTSSLESFHNLVCSYTSKSVHYFHAQMEARSVDVCFFLSFISFFFLRYLPVKGSFWDEILRWSSIVFFFLY